MSVSETDGEVLIRQFEEMGEAQVRSQFDSFQHPVHVAAQRWLAAKERESKFATDALITEQMAVARSAKRAAWIAAVGAIAATTIAALGLAVTIAAWLWPRPY